MSDELAAIREPQTEAGRRLVAMYANGGTRPYPTAADIVAIETEARRNAGRGPRVEATTDELAAIRKRGSALYSYAVTHGLHVNDEAACREYVVGECALALLDAEREARASADASVAALREALEDLHGLYWRADHRPGDFPDECRFCAVLTNAARDERLAREAGTYEANVEAMAAALHEDCRLEWQAISVVDPTRQITQHGPDAHYGKAHDLVRRLHPELDR